MAAARMGPAAGVLPLDLPKWGVYPEAMAGCNVNGTGLWHRLYLLSGRVRRLVYALFFPGYVEASIVRRHGTCRRCGACCQMGARCRHLRFDENNLAVCAVYGRRLSPNCRNFPIDERDLRDRDMVMPHQPCGYSFNGRAGRR